MTTPSPRLDPIVASRDGIGIAPSRPPRPGRPEGGGGGPSTGWLSGLLLVLVVALVAAAVWQYQTYQQLLARFEQVENKLSSTDESMSQNGAALQVKLNEQGDKLDTHWSEIRKLWGVANDRNRDNIAANRKDIDFLAAKRAEFDKQIAALGKQLKEQEAALAQSGVNNLALAADLERLGAERSKGIAAADQLGSQIDALKAELAAVDEAIRAFDGYRRQTNQRLLKLEQGTAAP